MWTSFFATNFSVTCLCNGKELCRKFSRRFFSGMKAPSGLSCESFLGKMEKFEGVKNFEFERKWNFISQ